MFIANISPDSVAEKSTLIERLLAEAYGRGDSIDYLKQIIKILPRELIYAGAFLDKRTQLWRYEFGVPYDMDGELFWGTHMWVPVNYLYRALLCVHSRLPENRRLGYLKRLADPRKHQDVLVEMIPAEKLNTEVEAQFEVHGHGVGNKTIDWVIGPHDSRIVFLDVKRRTKDFIEHAVRIGNKPVAPEPNHAPSLLFRGVEEKFLSADSSQTLQGVWVVTDIKQNEQLLSAAFATLNTNKVHFAVLGDWRPDAHLLIARAEDEQYLRGLFHLEKSTRFTFAANVSSNASNTDTLGQRAFGTSTNPADYSESS